MNATTDMISGGILRVFLRYAIPWSISLLASGSAAIVDGIFIGRYAGSMALASVNLVIPVFSLVWGIGVMFAAGGSAMTGNYMGRGDVQAASAMLIKTLLAVFLVSGACCVFCLLLQEELLDFLGVNETLRKDSSIYLGALAIFFPTFQLCLSLSFFVRLDQRPIMASAGLIICSVINVILDWLLIDIENLGVYGAAMATGLAYCSPCLFYLLHFFSSRSTYIWPKRLGKWSEVLKAAWNGLSECVNETSAGIIVLVFNIILMHRIGPAGVAAFTVLGYIAMLGALLFYGFSDSLVPIISVNNGARLGKRMRKFLVCGLVIVGSLGLFFFAFICLWPQLPILFFLPHDPEAGNIAGQFLNEAKWQFLIMGLNMILASYFTGRLWATSSFLTAFFRSFLFPFSLLMIYASWFDIKGMFYIPPISETLTLMIALVFYWKGIRNAKIPASARA